MTIKAMSAPFLAPERRAKELLLGYLSPYQRWMFLKLNYFYVRSPSGHVYAITDGRHVLTLGHDGRPVYVHAIWLMEEEPVSDHRLMQYLLLTSNESLFHQIACASRLTFPTSIIADDGRYLRGFLAAEGIKRPAFRMRVLGLHAEILDEACDPLPLEPGPLGPLCPDEGGEAQSALWPPVDALFGAR